MSLQSPSFHPETENAVAWDQVKTVLLDMDGTLLDRHFDDHFFLETVPEAFAKKNGLEIDQARDIVIATYKKVENTLAWYDLDYWSEKLGLDIPLLKHEVAHLIQVHPYVIDFLEAVRVSGRPVHLATNAHAHSLALKMSKTDIGQRFDTIVSSHELGLPKENIEFWPLLQKRLGFEFQHTLLVDDSEPVLQSARSAGIGHLLHIAAPSSHLSPSYSRKFPSIRWFKSVMPIPEGRGLSVPPRFNAISVG